MTGSRHAGFPSLRRGRTGPAWRSRWCAPVTSLALGALLLGAFALGGDLPGGLRALVVMAVLAAVLALGRRSETLQGLSGPGRDERWAMIDLRATWCAGIAVLAVALGAWLYEIATGGDGRPYSALLAVGALAYVVAVLVLRHRS